MTRMAWASWAPTGRGCLEHFNLDSAAVPILVGTLGKAFGCFGAFVAADADYIEWLLQTRAQLHLYDGAAAAGRRRRARGAGASRRRKAGAANGCWSLPRGCGAGAAQAGIAAAAFDHRPSSRWCSATARVRWR